MINKKYVIHPGYVISMSDGQEHYVTARQLIRLYRVNPNECIVISESGDNHRGLNLNDFIHLYPRINGDYTLPTKARE